jgi:hypothetical protein
MDIGEDFDAGEVGTECGKQLELGCGGVGVSGDDDNATFGSWRAVWHGSTGRDGGGNLKGEERFAAVVIAIEEGDAG